MCSADEGVVSALTQLLFCNGKLALQQRTSQGSVGVGAQTAQYFIGLYQNVLLASADTSTQLASEVSSLQYQIGDLVCRFSASLIHCSFALCMQDDSIQRLIYSEIDFTEAIPSINVCVLCLCVCCFVIVLVLSFLASFNKPRTTCCFCRSSSSPFSWFTH